VYKFNELCKFGGKVHDGIGENHRSALVVVVVVYIPPTVGELGVFFKITAM